MIAIVQRLSRNPAIAQLVRFGVAGVLLTVLVSVLYWVLATPLGIEARLASTLAYLLVVGLGYILHSRYSFRGHGGRDRPAVRTARFFVTSFIGYLMNLGFVWLLVTHLGMATWWPILGFLFVTPLVTFVLNRRWTFS